MLAVTELFELVLELGLDEFAELVGQIAEDLGDAHLDRPPILDHHHVGGE